MDATSGVSRDTCVAEISVGARQLTTYVTTKEDSIRSDGVEVVHSDSVPGASRLRASIFVARPIEDVFAFFSNAHNLQRITPDYLEFNILTPAPIDMREGALIDYKLRVRGIPIRWRTLISEWAPPYRFVDEQIKGPYRVWRHEHRFEPENGGTRVWDDVTFRPIGGALMTWLFVGRDVRRIFEYRSTVLSRIFAHESSP